MSTPDPQQGVLTGGTPPTELNLLASQTPRLDGASASPGAGSSSPGIALAAARVPGAPTLPDFDPISLTRVVSLLANELFAAPPAAPTPLGVSADAPTGVGVPAFVPPGSAPSAASVSEPFSSGTSVPVDSGFPATSAPPVSLLPESRSGGTAVPTYGGIPSAHSPFDAPLNFDAIARPVDPWRIGAPELALAPVVEDAAPLPDVAVPSSPSIAEPTTKGAAPTAPPERLAAPSAPPERLTAPNDDAFRFDAIEIVPSDVPRLDSQARGTPFDAHAIQREFPILNERVRGKRLVWLDNAATTQKPRAVIERLSYFYEHENSNIHRAAHTLAARATDAYEGAREKVRRFINAPSSREIIFVRGATEGINLIAQSWGRRNVAAGDEIVITWLEHHANIVPWQQLCIEKGARLRVAPVDSQGQVILEEYEKLLNPKTKLVSLTQVSNALGTITPAAEMIDIAHRHGALTVLDGAQAVSHTPVDVQRLGADFFVFSGHKVFGPTGIGAVFGRAELLDAMPPWQGGGNMIQDVTFERTSFHPAPARFEAGTGNIADAVGLGAALDWVSAVGIERIERYEHELLEYATERLLTVPGLTLIGTAPSKAGVLSFVLAGQKTEEVGGLLDLDGIAVRSGHHCAQPILRRYGLEATVRASLAPYNTFEDIDALVAALLRLQTGHFSASR